MMTETQAQQQVVVCDNQIVSSYSELQRAAMDMGAGAVRAASDSMKKKLLIPAILFIIGLLICRASVVDGIIVMVVAAIAAYSLYSSASAVKALVQKQNAEFLQVIAGIRQI